MKKTINEYIKIIPEDFEGTLKGLGNKFRFALALLLTENGPLSFTEISRLTQKEKGFIVNHIKKLELGGIIQNFLQRRKGTNDYSFYEITEYGEKIIRDLLTSYNEYYSKVGEWQIITPKTREAIENTITKESKTILPEPSKKIEENPLT